MDVCGYMASFILGDSPSILEPTPGEGNLVKQLSLIGRVTAPLNFFELSSDIQYDYVVMNPPFSPMKLGYDILFRCMGLSNNIIALMPWLTIINGDKRTNFLLEVGLRSITHLPRNVFKGARVQACIMELHKGYRGDTLFRIYKRNQGVNNG